MVGLKRGSNRMPMVPFDTDDIRDHLFSPWLLPGCRNSQGIVAGILRHDDLNGSIWLDYDELDDECDTRTIERPGIHRQLAFARGRPSVSRPSLVSRLYT